VGVYCDEACPGKEQTGAISIMAFSLKNQETASAKTLRSDMAEQLRIMNKIMIIQGQLVD
jgi:ribonuclease HI